MSDSTIGLQEPGSPTKLLDTEQLTVGLNTVERERMQLAGAIAAAIVAVLNSAPAGSEYALVTRNIPSGTQDTNPTDRALRDMGKVDVAAFDASLPAGTNNIGDVDVLTVPTDPFGANADAASATGSISAKLRFLAATGLAGMTSLPAGTNNIGDVDVLWPDELDYDTGAGTDNRAVVGLVVPASGGAVPVGHATTPLRVFEQVSTAFSTGQATVDTVADLIIAANTSRKRVIIVNPGSATVYIGASGVTTSTGFALAGNGASMTILSDDAVYGVVASGTATLGYWEETY